jgi:hypothetical protein
MVLFLIANKKLRNVFRVKLQIATVFLMLSHVNKKNNHKMALQPNHVNPNNAFKKLLCYKMIAVSTFLKPCFTDKLDYIVGPRPINL